VVPSGHVNQALDVLGCQAEVVSFDPSSLDKVLDGVLQVDKAAGVQERAEEVVAGLRKRLADVQAAVEGLERPRVFALEWGDPPFNGGYWVPEMLQVAGAEAVLACQGAPSVRATWEQVEAASPQVVVFMPCGYGLQAAVGEASRTLLGRPKLAGVEAIVPSTPAPTAPVRVPAWSTASRSSPPRSNRNGSIHHQLGPPCDSGDELDQPSPGARAP
jgi:ABC-type Fe3+-hydroxamate transport system substrate-binding protein